MSASNAFPHAQIMMNGSTGTVVNTLMLNIGDVPDKSYIWVPLTNPIGSDGIPIQIGSSYDGTNFTTTIVAAGVQPV